MGVPPSDKLQHPKSCSFTMEHIGNNPLTLALKTHIQILKLSLPVATCDIIRNVVDTLVSYTILYYS